MLRKQGILGSMMVAVKRLSKPYLNETKFHLEVQCLMRVKHKHIVRFWGYCADTQGNIKQFNGELVRVDVRQRLLCFEYIPKGSLDVYIIGTTMWPQTCIFIFFIHIVQIA